MVKASAWKLQRELKGKNIPNQDLIIAKAYSFNLARHRALFVMAYLTGGRITEIVRKKWKYTNIYRRHKITDPKINKKKWVVVRNENRTPLIESKVKERFDYPGLLRRDITFENHGNGEVMIVHMDNRKNKKVNKKRIPIPVYKEPQLAGIIKEYIKDMSDDTPLFPMGYCSAWRIITKVGMNPHFLRDIRLTHLVTLYDYNAFELTKFAGWTDARPAETYVRLGIRDLIRKF